jgi:gamma-glutamylcyclotransferase (GGCT)/AIG2-like uncharacterized protein YtfP
MPNVQRNLFVYGTLMQSARGTLGQTQRARLKREARILGPATISAAKLYDLGRYPGLVETGDPADVVHGEVLALISPERTFVWLDAYEDIAPGDDVHNDYARLERPIRLARGNVTLAWVYVFLRDVARRRVIPGGKWY